jgi:hypothetical protein
VASIIALRLKVAILESVLLRLVIFWPLRGLFDLSAHIAIAIEAALTLTPLT